jgi:hypothetical protein
MSFGILIVCLLVDFKNYIVQRNIFLIGIREISNDLPIDELTLLSGNEILNDEKNTKMFLQVQKFIQDTGNRLKYKKRKLGHRPIARVVKLLD